jgi:hypothetical protein
VIDTRPREFPEADRQRLQDMADALMIQVEDRVTAGELRPLGIDQRSDPFLEPRVDEVR